MKISTRISILLPCCLLSALAQDTIERRPLAVGTKIETGQIVDGDKSQWEGGDPDKYYLSNIGVNLTQEVVINRSTEIKVGVGGVFYYSFPEERSTPATQGTKFGPGVSQAQALFKFGNPEFPLASLRIGYFPYKYNPDAKNLGEYLFRSMPYPAIVTTGGWFITDNAMIRAQGLHLNFTHGNNGMFKHDFLFTSERDFRPQGDFTPSYSLEANVGPFQVGGGVAFHHFLPINGKRLQTDFGSIGTDLVVRYGSFPGFTSFTDSYSGNDLDTVIHQPGQPLTATLADVDNIVFDNNTYGNGTLVQQPDHSILDTSTGILYVPDTVIFTIKGVKMMARASFHFQKLMRLNFLGPEDLKIYGEAALLGWENQPAYYEKRSERIPCMAGINLPAFNLLDVLALELEYFGNPMPDDLEQMISRGKYNPVPSYSGVLHPEVYHRDDWKWSVFASKKIVTGFSLRVQAANDHFRAPQKPPQSHLFTSEPVTRSPSNWYYVVTLNFGI